MCVEYWLLKGEMEDTLWDNIVGGCGPVCVVASTGARMLQSWQAAVKSIRYWCLVLYFCLFVSPSFSIIIFPLVNALSVYCNNTITKLPMHSFLFACNHRSLTIANGITCTGQMWHASLMRLYMGGDARGAVREGRCAWGDAVGPCARGGAPGAMREGWCCCIYFVPGPSFQYFPT